MSGISVGDRPILLAECMLLGAGKCHFEFQFSWFCLYLFVDFAASFWFLVFTFLFWGKDKN